MKWRTWVLIIIVGFVAFTFLEKTFESPAKAASPNTRIVINVPEKTLFLYRNNHLFQKYPVAIGKPQTPSPRGQFVITQKAVWGDGFGTRWMRISVPWGIYGIHGTNKPWSVGTVASHGCFRMLNHDVEQVYALVSVGTPVDVVGNEPFTTIKRPLHSGVIGQDVVELQRQLQMAKVYRGPLNGVYNEAVKQSIEKFQLMMNLPQTGIASLETLRRLAEYTKQDKRIPKYLATSQKY